MPEPTEAAAARLSPARKEPEQTDEQQCRAEPEQDLGQAATSRGSGSSALTSTPFAWSCAVSAVLFQNAGTWVENSVVGVAFLLPGG